MKLITYIAALAAACVTLSASAGLQVQTDTNSLAAFSTNTYVLNGDISGSFTNGQTMSGAPVISCISGSEAYFAVGGFFTNSTAQSSNIVFKVAQSVDNVLWTNSAFAITLVIPGNTTNWVTGHFYAPYAFPLYGLRSTENPNAANVSAQANTVFLKAFTRPGI